MTANLTSVVEQILDQARWAPSGDNAQPWRFELIDDSRFVIHGRDTRDHCIYDLDGCSSQLALGALIETAAIAATRHGLALEVMRRPGMPDHLPTFDARLSPSYRLFPSPLLSAIPLRSVQRRPLSMRTVSAHDRSALAHAVAPGYALRWFDSAGQRLQWAALLWSNAGLRLSLPEAFETHRGVIAWGSRFSKDRIPDQALGADALTTRVMRAAMANWQRVAFMNRWMLGTVAPRLAMDLWPALACAAHVALVAHEPLQGLDAQVAGGRAVQRFWLTAASLGLQHQPAATPLVFARYLRNGQAFTGDAKLTQQARQLAMRLETMLEQQTSQTVWLGRIGYGSPAASRSVRLDLEELLVAKPARD